MTDFRASANLDSLKARASLLRRTRRFFDSRGLIEVQTPLLSADTVVDRHLDPVSVLLPNSPFEPKSGRRMWLQTSPEFAMKRVLASGVEAIYQISSVFRIGEAGAQHNPEFTMLEWYRCGDSMSEGIELLSELVAELLTLSTAKVITVRDAFQSLAGFDPFLLSSVELRKQCQLASIAIPKSVDDEDWDTWFDLLFTEIVQPELGHDTPVIIHDYPASQAALAQIRLGEPDVAERFELFVNGVELANGYHELLDAEVLLRRNHDVNIQRVADGKGELPVESRLLEAMRSGLPPCTGVALGFDRLVMLATGAKSINEVISFPVDRA